MTPSFTEEQESHSTLSSRYRNGLLVRGLVWGLSLVLFVVTLEVSIRIGDRLQWGAPLVGAYSHEALFGTDSLGWRPRPGAAFEKWEINSMGFRGPELELNADPGTTRIVVLGSSETFGQAESPDMDFPRQLEATLNESRGVPGAPTPSFEVINAGVPGMTVPRIGEYWNHWVARFQPEYVVVYPSPGFYLDETPPPDESPRESEGGFPRRPDSPRLPGRTRVVINRFIPETVESHLKRGLISRKREQHQAEWIWRVVPPERVALFRRHLRELLEQLLASGVKPIVATHASAVKRPIDGEDQIILLGWQKFRPRAEAEVLVDFEVSANEVIEEVASSLGIPVAPVAAEVPAERRFFSDHQHFTDAGAKLVAQVISRSLLEAMSPTVPGLPDSDL